MKLCKKEILMDIMANMMLLALLLIFILIASEYLLDIDLLNVLQNLTKGN